MKFYCKGANGVAPGRTVCIPELKWNGTKGDSVDVPEAFMNEFLRRYGSVFQAEEFVQSNKKLPTGKNKKKSDDLLD